MIIHLVETQLLYEDRQTDRRTEERLADSKTDMTKLIVVFRSFVNAPKTLTLHYQCRVMQAKIKIYSLVHICDILIDLWLSLTYEKNVFGLIRIQPPIFIVKIGYAFIG
jgi:hypothetical protein